MGIPALFHFDWNLTLACVYRPSYGGFASYFKPIYDFTPPHELIGRNKEIEQLVCNTSAFIQGKAASHVLLYGARGSGKSSIIQYVLGTMLAQDKKLRVIELDSQHLGILPLVIDNVRELPFCFVVVCDDMCFNPSDKTYKTLKTLLEGSFENKARNTLIYATSNHRHLIVEEYPQDTLHLGDAHDEILSLSDRFGLSIGFYSLSRKEFLDFIQNIANEEIDEQMCSQALQFAAMKGSCSPRIAYEFYTLYCNGVLKDIHV